MAGGQSWRASVLGPAVTLGAPRWRAETGRMSAGRKASSRVLNKNCRREGMNLRDKVTKYASHGLQDHNGNHWRKIDAGNGRDQFPKRRHYWLYQLVEPFERRLVPADVWKPAEQA